MTEQELQEARQLVADGCASLVSVNGLLDHIAEQDRELAKAKGAAVWNGHQLRHADADAEKWLERAERAEAALAAAKQDTARFAKLADMPLELDRIEADSLVAQFGHEQDMFRVSGKIEYVCSVTWTIVQDDPPENLRAAIDAAREVK